MSSLHSNQSNLKSNLKEVSSLHSNQSNLKSNLKEVSSLHSNSTLQIHYNYEYHKIASASPIK